MSACHSTRMHSLLKTVLGKNRDRYQAYCTTYKMHAMATCHRGRGCPLYRGLDILTEDLEHADIENKISHNLDTAVALEGFPEDPVFENQDKLTVLMREINSLHQWLEAGEVQPTETLDHRCELQNLLIALHQPPPPTPTEPFREVIQQYTDTLCTTQKQSNLMNSLLQNIAVFNEHDSTKLEEWLMDIEMVADFTSESRPGLTKAKSRINK